MFDVTTLKFNSDGLIPAIAQEDGTGEILMMAWMNAEAVLQTLTTNRVTYWSRSRSKFWIKGETSGHTQELVDMKVDCDRDCLLLTIRQIGPACHTNRKSCFYTSVTQAGETILTDPLL